MALWQQKLSARLPDEKCMMYMNNGYIYRITRASNGKFVHERQVIHADGVYLRWEDSITYDSLELLMDSENWPRNPKSHTERPFEIVLRAQIQLTEAKAALTKADSALHKLRDSLVESSSEEDDDDYDSDDDHQRKWTPV